MNPDQPNSGSFMSGATGGQNGVGPALMRLMSQRQQGQAPSPMDQNSQAPNAVAPAAPPQGGSAIPQGMAQPPQAGTMPMMSGTPELQIALNALSQYIKAHGNVLEAHHNVPLKKAQAQAMNAGQENGS